MEQHHTFSSLVYSSVSRGYSQVWLSLVAQSSREERDSFT